MACVWAAVGRCQEISLYALQKHLPSNVNMIKQSHQTQVAHDVENYRLSSNMSIKLDQISSFDSVGKCHLFYTMYIVSHYLSFILIVSVVIF